MDRNTTIGLILIGLILTLFTVINQPSNEEIAKAKKEQALKEKVKKNRRRQKKTARRNQTIQGLSGKIKSSKFFPKKSLLKQSK